MSGYKFDVFISYSRSNNSCKWVRNHFSSRLLDCLDDQLDAEPRVFRDEEMEKGVHWPHRLEQALLHSKIMVAIYTAPYFRSRWCMAEWQSMRGRENLLGLAGPGRAQGLIYPILVADSDNFPCEARYRSWWDFKQWYRPDLVFQQTKAWLGFHQEVERVAADLARLLPQVPDWQPDWPVERPDPPLLPPAQVPRFGQ